MSQSINHWKTVVLYQAPLTPGTEYFEGKAASCSSNLVDADPEGRRSASVSQSAGRCAGLD